MPVDQDRYKWIALSNTTLSALLATIDVSILLVAMPEIFRGIKLDPLQPGNSFYLLWMILGFLVVSSVLVVSLGRLGDIYGRVRMYNIGFAVYTVASLLLAIDWMHGDTGADWLIIFRIVQGIGAAFLIANTAAILTDAFPPHQRGLALGINTMIAVSGQFLGLVLGGVLAAINWRLVFLVSVPPGIIGTIWSYRSLREVRERSRAPIDWLGNLTFAAGLMMLMIGITYGIRPYGTQTMGWRSPFVLACIGIGVLLIASFVVVESKVKHPMFHLPLFRIRAFSFGVLSNFLAAIARGGLMFMLIIWLQGVWLPQHGYDFSSTPMQAGIRILPMTFGVLLAGPLSGFLSDRFGSRPFATAGMLLSALSFILLLLLPIDFPYPEFAVVVFLMGISIGTFVSPNRAGVMNSLPAAHRGAGGGMNVTFQNSAQVLSIGVFFTLLIVGLSSTLPHALSTGLVAHGVPPATAARASHVPPISIIFASFLGYNPAGELLGNHVLAQMPAHDAAVVNGRSFFPHLIAAPFRYGLHTAFAFAILCCLVGAASSWFYGRHVPATKAKFPSAEEAEVGVLYELTEI